MSPAQSPSHPNAKKDGGDDDECIVLEDDYVQQHRDSADMRRFPDRVWDMVVREAAVHDGVFQWEAEFEGGQAFGVERNSTVLEEIVRRYFGRDASQRSFIERLYKYGWTRVRSAKYVKVCESLVVMLP